PIGRRVGAVASGDVRRPAICAHLALRRHDRADGILRHSSCDGLAHRHLEQPSLDDHGVVCGRERWSNVMMRRTRFLALLGSTALAGCAGAATNLTENEAFHRVLELPERLNLALLGAGQPLAREYAEADVSPMFRQN